MCVGKRYVEGGSNSTVVTRTVEAAGSIQGRCALPGGTRHALKMAKRMLTNLRLLQPEAPCEAERRKGLPCLGQLPSCEHASLQLQLLEQHTAPVDAPKPNLLKTTLLKENLEVLWRKAGATALVLCLW